MNTTAPLRVGQTLIGPLFNEPMRVETVSAAGNSSWVVGLVGAQSERFRRVTLSEADLADISILDADMAFNGDSDGSVLLSPNERRMAKDRRDCYWLYVVTHCNMTPRLREPIRDPARLEWT